MQGKTSHGKEEKEQSVLVAPNHQSRVFLVSRVDLSNVQDSGFDEMCVPVAKESCFACGFTV